MVFSISFFSIGIIYQLDTGIVNKSNGSLAKGWSDNGIPGTEQGLVGSRERIGISLPKARDQILQLWCRSTMHPKSQWLDIIFLSVCHFVEFDISENKTYDIEFILGWCNRIQRTIASRYIFHHELNSICHNNKSSVYHYNNPMKIGVIFTLL